MYVCMCVCKDVSMYVSNMYLSQTHINAEAMPRNRMEREDTSYGGRRAMEHRQFTSLGLLRFGGPTRQKTRQEIDDPQRGPSTIHANLKVLVKTARLAQKGPRR